MGFFFHFDFRVQSLFLTLEAAAVGPSNRSRLSFRLSDLLTQIKSFFSLEKHKIPFTFLWEVDIHPIISWLFHVMVLERNNFSQVIFFAYWTYDQMMKYDVLFYMKLPSSMLNNQNIPPLQPAMTFKFCLHINAPTIIWLFRTQRPFFCIAYFYFWSFKYILATILSKVQSDSFTTASYC